MRNIPAYPFRNAPPADEAFDWHEGNAFCLLIDGDQFFPRMLEAIAAARRTILLEMYLMRSGRVADLFIEALVAAAGRGVAVHLLLDDFGCRGLSTSDRRRLQRQGIHLTWYNPLRFWRFRRNLSRDHRKLLLIDGERAFTGGLGITDDFDPVAAGNRHWRETVIEIRGPVVDDWRSLFRLTWDRWSTLPPVDDKTDDTATERTMRGSSRGRVQASHQLRPVTLSRSLERRALLARHRIWIATAYFIPNRRLRKTLRRKARQGLDVRLLLPGPITDHPGVRYASRRYYAPLLRDGVRIFEFQPRFMHSKLVLCDDWIAIGSSNYDRWNLRRNLEANQEVEDSKLAAEAQLIFEVDLQNAAEISKEQWQQRPWHDRLREWFWRRIEVILDKDR